MCGHFWMIGFWRQLKLSTAVCREYRICQCLSWCQTYCRSIIPQPRYCDRWQNTDSGIVLHRLFMNLAGLKMPMTVLASGTICGHLPECGIAFTGAHFADPGFKDALDLAHVSFVSPQASEDGSFYILQKQKAQADV